MSFSALRFSDLLLMGLSMSHNLAQLKTFAFVEGEKMPADALIYSDQRNVLQPE